jgi:protein phosphatase
MSAPMSKDKLRSAAVSDRGLNEKRPLNEDSFLADAARGIFAVADGVGGAEAGEVASQTAIEVLDDAFHHRLGNGEDAEDLMELAIQRANSSIHRMAVEHPRFSMMATTIVTLHLEADRATIGHVGDSRLYRLGPEGELYRETRDHSMVEEEVRAGRMTPEQAANHPSKNVISRALGAEASVEVDLKTIEVEEGTRFLLCSDGITRHIPDQELRELLASNQPLDAICQEMKRRCYERGAEDNLTAVVVQVGTPNYAVDDGERTISTARVESSPTTPLNAAASPETRLTPASRLAFPGPTTPPAPETNALPPPAKTHRRGGAMLRFLVFLLFIAVAAGAFYGGMKYQTIRLWLGLEQSKATPQTPAPIDRAAAFEAKRAEVDSAPQKWLADHKASDSKDPEFLYLYGRALMLTGDHHGAMNAFDQALVNLRQESKGKLPLDVEVRLASASAALKFKEKSPDQGSQAALSAEQKAMQTLDDLLNLKSEGGGK